ncbi:MAG: 5-(carboxyamino)imidazole ribonucleotide synthase [Chitinophagales bacterium]
MKRIGILGGGQLGRMLLQAAANYPVYTMVLEKGTDAPAALLCDEFTNGDIRNFDSVLMFGRKADVITIEIENVNIEALFQLQQEGKTIIPRPEVLQIIRDKGLQKQFYQENNIPTAPFVLTERASELNNYIDFLPAAHKLRTGGYDGKGVAIITNQTQLNQGFDAPSVLEKGVAIAKEIAVTVACNNDGDLVIYPAVEMVFDPQYNLVDYQIAPAQITAEQAATAAGIAVQVVKAFNSAGIFAIEMFLDKNGAILVNETAPRTHNSGHQSIEANYTSQFEMQLRLLLDLPLGNPELREPALMWNIIGAPDVNGTFTLSGLEETLAIPNTYLHLYGKTSTKPGRKLGHLTLLGPPHETVRWIQHIKQLVVTKPA